MNESTSAAAGVRCEASLIEVNLTEVRPAAQGTNLYQFSRTDRAPLPAAEPGAHVDVHLPNGMMRQYSLVVPDPAPHSYVLGVKRDPNSRGGSRYFFEDLKIGQSLKIAAPRNNFPLVADVTHTVLFAGGIGITPIWAMVQRLRDSKNSWELHYSCRSRADMAFLADVHELEFVHTHFDDESGGKFLDLAGIVSKAPKDAHFYCCGPVPMLDAFHAEMSGFAPEQVHSEYFAAKDAPSLDGGFVVELARTGKEFVIPPGKSILNVLRAAGLNLDSSCEEGICGVCEKAVISGIPDHRDSILSDSEHAANKTMMICCSGCTSDRLVLDM